MTKQQQRLKADELEAKRKAKKLLAKTEKPHDTTRPTGAPF